MITYINAKNAEQYQILFSKAAALLKAKQPAGLTETLTQYGMTWDNFAIGSLNEYFAYLEELTKAATTDNEKKFFVRLPLDEDVFAINADSRAISVPSSFSRYGVGVQGDEMAEVVYFTIDRYFDSTDLANDDVEIAIQWEAKDVNKRVITGFSRNFGKDVETIPGKIIFGWPISSELTQTNGTIKFAVRFYTIDTIDEVKQFTYSFTTLPAEISVNASLDYDLINKTVPEIDHGQVILNRIKNSGIYDPSLEIPEVPTITSDLFILSPEENETATVVDLPTDGSGVKLAIAAKPTTSGIITYDWKKFAYDENTGDYSATSGGLDSGDSITISYVEETEDIPENTISQYYGLTGGVYELVDLGTIEKDQGIYTYYENHGFKLVNTSSYKKLYKRYSVATVHKVGVYAVDVSAKILINTTKTTMGIDGGIKIPGPLKPTVSFPVEDNVSDNVDHVISNNGENVTLTAAAVKGETGKPTDEVGADPQVDLAYNWKKIINGVASEIDGTGADMTVTALPVSKLPTSEAWLENTNDGEYGAFNQENVIIAQDGNAITIHKLAELKSYPSTVTAQGTHEWIALDIDTGIDDITTLTWNGQALTEDDVAEAAGLGLGAGHIIYWAKADALTTPTENTIGDVTLTFAVVTGAPTDIQYSFNSDKSEMTIIGLEDAGLDRSYFVEVTATRNNISTTETSGTYRVTNSPVKPVIKVRQYNTATNNFELVTKDYQSTENVIRTVRRASATMPTLSFSVEPPQISDSISYIWMRVKADDNVETDWENGAEKLQVDLDTAIDGLAAIIGNPIGEADYPVEASPIAAARKYLTTLPAIGIPTEEDYEDNGPKYELGETDPSGYYYCVVINELNGNINANVSPFYQVT